MAASFPTSVKSFTTKVDGAGGDLVAAADVNGLQDEVIAIETELKKTTGSVVDHGGLAGLADNDHPQYSLTTHNHDADYLGITAKAADSDKLNGEPASTYSLATHDHDADYSAITHLHTGIYAPVDGWTPVSDTWTYASATTITVPAGATAIYEVGDKIKLTQTTVKQFVITAVASSVLTIFGGSENTLVNAAISNIYYSHIANPLDFPQYFSYTPAITYEGGTTDPTSWASVSGFFYSVGRMAQVTVNGACTRGSGDRTIVKFSLPVPGYDAYGTAGHSLLETGVTNFAVGAVNSTNLEIHLLGAMAVDGSVFATVTYFMD